MSVKKRIKPGRIEASADGESLVVHFTTELTHLDESGAPGHVEKAPDQREVPLGRSLQGLSEDDLADLAKEIVDRCRYIPATKTRHVEQVLLKLHASQQVLGDRSRQDVLSPPSRHSGRDRPKGAESRDPNMTRSTRHSAECRYSSGSAASSTPSALITRPQDLLPDASAECMDDYAEELYEEQMEKKAVGAQRVLGLCMDVRLLRRICEHSTLLGVLSRELRENAKRSHELAVAITGIFVCLAHFSHWHGFLVQHQCCDATMRLVEYESKRRAVLHKDLKLNQGQIVARGSQTTAQERAKLEREERRYQSVLLRTDRLLLLCLMVLRDLAEDNKIERKLCSQKLCHFIVPLLARQNEDLLSSTLGFLQKLSLIKQNKDYFVSSSDALTYLSELVGHPNPDIAHLALRVCFNLTFDSKGRSALATQTLLLTKLLAAAQQASLRKVALQVMYHLSIDVALRGTIAIRHPGCIALALQLAAASSRSKEQQADGDAIAFCINLAADEACCAVMVEQAELPKLALRAVKHGGNQMLLKIMRHMVSHRRIRLRVLESLRADGRGDSWLLEVLRLAGSTTDKPEIQVEAIGCLSALDCQTPEVPWPTLCEKGLLELLYNQLIIGFAEDDVLLECIVLAGVLALDQECITLLAASKVPAALPALLAEKAEDSEIITQLLFAIRCLLLEPETREVILMDTDAPELIMDLLRDGAHDMEDASSRAMQATAEDLLQLILVFESEVGAQKRWSERITALRFELHNQDWCHADSPLEKTRASTTCEAGAAMKWTDVRSIGDRKWTTNAFRSTTTAFESFTNAFPMEPRDVKPPPALH